MNDGCPVGDQSGWITVSSQQNPKPTPRNGILPGKEGKDRRMQGNDSCGRPFKRSKANGFGGARNREDRKHRRGAPTKQAQGKKQKSSRHEKPVSHNVQPIVSENPRDFPSLVLPRTAVVEQQQKIPKWVSSKINSVPTAPDSMRVAADVHQQPAPKKRNESVAISRPKSEQQQQQLASRKQQNPNKNNIQSKLQKETAQATYRLQMEDFPSLGEQVKQTPKATIARVIAQPGKSPTVVLKREKLGGKKKAQKIAGNLIKGQKAGLESTSLVQRPLEGTENDLFRMIQEGKVTVEGKGIRGVRPRKKRFSSLKKKLLEERLRKWNESQGVCEAEQDTDKIALSATVCLVGLAVADDLKDEDEYDEICSNLEELASGVGKAIAIYIPRINEKADSPDGSHPVFVRFADEATAGKATGCWNGLILGGNEVLVRHLEDSSGPLNNDQEWRDWCISSVIASEACHASGASDSVSQSTELVLENALTDDDLEDEECMEESVADICAMVSEYGEVEAHRIIREPTPLLVLRFKVNERQADTIARKLSTKVIGGTLISARLLRQALNGGGLSASSLILQHVLTREDVEDEDCLEESLNDIKGLAGQYGEVKKVDADTNKLLVFVTFSSEAELKRAQSAFNGMVIGGMVVSAAISGQTKSILHESPPATIVAEHEPLFSGDKRIPERFAECKRAPKIPGSGQPRSYAIISENKEVKPMLSDMLSELMRLQRRAIADNNSKAKRRLVMGLREVARGIRSRKVRMIIMANNLDDYEALDQKLKDILELSTKHEVPTFFEFSKRTLGKAIGKSIKVAIVGVQNVDGAEQLFKKLTKLCPTNPVVGMQK